MSYEKCAFLFDSSGIPIGIIYCTIIFWVNTKTNEP